MIKKIFSILLISSIISCNQSSKITDEELVAVSNYFHEIFESAMLSKDLDSILEIYEEDAIYLPLAGTILKGKSNISKGYENSFQYDLNDFNMECVGLSGNAEYVMEVGLIHAIFQLDTSKIERSFKYLNIYRKQESGEYKIHRAIYNQNQKIN